MAGSMRFEMTSGSPEGPAFVSTYPNGPRGNYSGANLERSRSFREGIENRMLSSGSGSSRGSTTLSANMPPLSQCLTLEPIKLGDQKFTRAGELRRALGIPMRNTSEDHSFGAAHSKIPPPVAIEDLKRFKANVHDSCNKARDRAKILSESISKLDKYCEALDSRKKHRSELLSSERSVGTNLLKMGSQIHQTRPDLVNQRLEERTKNGVPNKRVRTSLAEVRAEGRTATLSRQPVVMDKDRDILRAGSGGSVQVEEKIRGLPTGGEGWDKKMKRKRSVGTVVTRTMDGDREVKRAMHQKLSSDPRTQSCDNNGFRSGPSNGISGINKLDATSQPTSSNARIIPRNELENVSLPRDGESGLDKERVVAKTNNKLNFRGDNQAGSPSSVTTGKASRAPRTGSAVVTNTSSNFPRTSGVPDMWEQPPSLNNTQSVGGTNNRKRPVPTGSSSPPMAQWVGQRPHKISRTRRANLVSPVSNHDEAQTSSEGFLASDIGGRLTSNEPNGSLLSRGVSNSNTQQFKMKLENVPSPARLPESEESGAGENKFQEKGVDSGVIDDRSVNAVQKVGSFLLPTNKNKTLNKEEIGDGVRRQGRSGRNSLLSRACVPALREKLENTATTKPLRSTRPCSDKNESKSGRPPSKKLSDRKASTRPGHVLNGGSSDFAGESDDDHEELLKAAKSVHYASELACSGSFWKKMEPIFASVSSEDTAYLKKQLILAEELDESLRHIFGDDCNVLGELVCKEVALPQPLVSGERQGSQPNGTGSNESIKAAGLVDQLEGIDTLFGRIDRERRFDKITPLYQRVLSALIGEDEIEEFDRNSERRDASFQYASESSCGTCNQIDVEPNNGGRMESDIESELNFRTQKQYLLDIFSCDSTASNSFRGSNMCDPLYNDELWQSNGGLVHSEVGIVPSLTDLDRPQCVHTNIYGISSVECQYKQMRLDDKLLLELQSIDIYPETVPDLAEGGEDEINKDIVELQKELYQQVGKKKDYLFKIDKAIQKERELEGRDLEQVAMNKLIEMAYKKQMACRGSSASKSGVSKISRQVALAFVKRTIARCQKFEDTGRSCFREPALRDLIFSAALPSNDAKVGDCDDSGSATNLYTEAHSCQREVRTSATGAFCGMVERHGPHNDKLDRGLSDAFQVLTHSSDQAFVKHEPSNRGKKREVLLDDVVGSATSRATSALGNTLLGGAKGKRSERERDQKDALARNSVAKAGRPSVSSYRGERKTKTKPKQKTAQLSSSGNGVFLGRLSETPHPVYPSVHGSSETVTSHSSKVNGEVGLLPPGNIPQDSSKETEEPVDFTNLQLHELNSIEELGVSNDLSGPQDLSSWLNFDEDGLQDHDSMGLEIPMDDLSELNMLI